MRGRHIVRSRTDMTVTDAHEEDPMQFVLLIYQGTTPLPNTEAWSSLSQDEQRAIYADYTALNNHPGLTPGLPLGLPENAKTVQVDNGATQTTDGPYAGPHGALGGYMVLEADDVDAAIELAARVPAARHGGAIEIRPVGTYW
jgi:hypothetical protein